MNTTDDIIVRLADELRIRAERGEKIVGITRHLHDGTVFRFTVEKPTLAEENSLSKAQAVGLALMEGRLSVFHDGGRDSIGKATYHPEGLRDADTNSWDTPFITVPARSLRLRMESPAIPSDCNPRLRGAFPPLPSGYIIIEGLTADSEWPADALCCLVYESRNFEYANWTFLGMAPWAKIGESWARAISEGRAAIAIRKDADLFPHTKDGAIIVPGMKVWVGWDLDTDEPFWDEATIDRIEMLGGGGGEISFKAPPPCGPIDYNQAAQWLYARDPRGCQKQVSNQGGRMDWREYIEQTPGVMLGKPCIRGTRLTVELILDKLSHGVPAEELMRSYPGLRAVHIQAAHAFVAASENRPST